MPTLLNSRGGVVSDCREANETGDEPKDARKTYRRKEGAFHRRNGALFCTRCPVVVLAVECRYVPAGNTGTTVAATGTTPHAATVNACCSHLCRAHSQALYRATGTTQPALYSIEGPLLC